MLLGAVLFASACADPTPPDEPVASAAATEPAAPSAESTTRVDAAPPPERALRPEPADRAAGHLAVLTSLDAALRGAARGTAGTLDTRRGPTWSWRPEEGDLVRLDVVAGTPVVELMVQRRKRRKASRTYVAVGPLGRRAAEPPTVSAAPDVRAISVVRVGSRRAIDDTLSEVDSTVVVDLGGRLLERWPIARHAARLLIAEGRPGGGQERVRVLDLDLESGVGRTLGVRTCPDAALVDAGLALRCAIPGGYAVIDPASGAVRERWVAEETLHRAADGRWIALATSDAAWLVDRSTGRRVRLDVSDVRDVVLAGGLLVALGNGEVRGFVLDTRAGSGLAAGALSGALAAARTRSSGDGAVAGIRPPARTIDGLPPELWTPAAGALWAAWHDARQRGDQTALGQTYSRDFQARFYDGRKTASVDRETWLDAWSRRHPGGESVTVVSVVGERRPDGGLVLAMKERVKSGPEAFEIERRIEVVEARGRAWIQREEEVGRPQPWRGDLELERFVCWHHSQVCESHCEPGDEACECAAELVDDAMIINPGRVLCTAVVRSHRTTATTLLAEAWTVEGDERVKVADELIEAPIPAGARVELRLRLDAVGAHLPNERGESVLEAHDAADTISVETPVDDGAASADGEYDDAYALDEDEWVDEEAWDIPVVSPADLRFVLGSLDGSEHVEFGYRGLLVTDTW